MSKSNAKNDIKVLAIDLAKSSFQLHGIDEKGEKVLGKKVSRKKLSEFMVRLTPCLIAMEACGSAHYWARLFKSYGHEVRLISEGLIPRSLLRSLVNERIYPQKP